MVTTDDLPDKTLLRPNEVASFLRVSLKTVYRWYARGSLKGIKVGRGLRIYRKSVIEALDRRETNKSQDYG